MQPTATGEVGMIVSDYEPLTHDLGLIDLPLDHVVDEFLRWHSEIGTGYSKHMVATSLGEALGALQPLSASMRRCLFAGTTSGWTAFFQGGIQGSDPMSVMSMLASRASAMAMRVCITASDDDNPAVIWEVYAPQSVGGEPPLGYRRSICAAKDGGRWVFEQSGAPFPFEDVAAYATRRTRDCFTPDLLKSYLREFGLTPHSDDFYLITAEAPAVVLERPPWQNEPQEFTLAEVRAGLPWRRTNGT